MTHDEIEELLGAYALDALDNDEREAVEDHLVTCPRCREEVAAHREVAALLGNTTAPGAAPHELWDRISASLQDKPPALATIRPSSWRRLVFIVPLGAAAAALVLAVALLATKVSNLDGEIGSLSKVQSVGSVILNPAHRTIRLTSATSTWQAEAVVLPNGEGYLLNPSMPALGPSQTFQLWALSGGKVVSLGVLGAHPNGVAIRVEPAMTALMITAEPLGGTPEPTTPVLVRGSLPVGL